MVDRVKTVQTQALQLWLKPTLEELGWEGASPVLGAYREPLDTWADMSHLVPREDWPADNEPGSIAYFCGPMKDAPFIPGPSDTSFPASQRARVAVEAQDFTEHFFGHLMPKGTAPGNPDALDYSLLFDPKDRDGRARMDAQYIRANIDPSERYVLSPKGATTARLDANKVYFSNLYVAGDWTRTGLNAGCVEAAVMSGRQCSRAMIGFPEHVIGETDLPGPQPLSEHRPGDYIWRPNDVVLTAPTLQNDTMARCFLMPGDREAMQRTVDGVLNKPALGQDRYVVLGDFWALVPMSIGKNVCKRPEWRSLGWTTETDWAILVPVGAVKRDGGREKIDRILCFVYGCFVDQPYAMATGRDVWGFPKTMSQSVVDGDLETRSTWVLETFSPDSRLSVRPVIQIRGGEPQADQPQHGVVRGVLSALLGAIPGSGALRVPGLNQVINLAEDILERQVSFVFLKQTRACDDTNAAVYQAVIEAPCTITAFRGGGQLEGAQVKLFSYASQPLHAELGAPEGWVEPMRSLWMSCDFELGGAERIWDWAKPQS